MYLNRCGIATQAAQAIKLFLANPLFGPPPPYMSCNRPEYRGSGESRGCLGVANRGVFLIRRFASTGRSPFVIRLLVETELNSRCLQFSSAIQLLDCIILYFASE